MDAPGANIEKVKREKPLDESQAKEEYEKSEKSLRYQLIEGKLISENNIQINLEDIKDHAKNMVRLQMAQFGQLDPSDQELDDIVARILSNKDEARRISEQLVSQKLLQLYKDKANIKVKKVTYENFVKEVYGDK